MKKNFLEINFTFQFKKTMSTTPQETTTTSNQSVLKAGQSTCGICNSIFTQPPRSMRKYCPTCVPSGYSYHKKYNRVYKDARAQRKTLTTKEKMPSPTPDEVDPQPEPTQQAQEVLLPTKGVGRTQVMLKLAENMKALDAFFDSVGSKKTFTKAELLREQANYLDTATFVYK